MPSTFTYVLVAAAALAAGACAELCTEDVCSYDFVVETTMSMTYYSKTNTADSKRMYLDDQGRVCSKNYTSGDLTPVAQDIADQVFVGDGYFRPIRTVNRMVPGPTIEVYEGAQIVVNVLNKLEDAPVTIHWHGMYQHGTVWMDGVSQITQCGILPGQNFTYRFIAEPAGTLSWHAHHGLERPDGLFGSLIVHRREPSLRDELCDLDTDVMVLNDHYHMNPVQVYQERVYTDFFPNETMRLPNGSTATKFPWSRSVDGRMQAEVPFVSALVNGRGRYQLHDGTWSPANFTVYAAETNKSLCIRVVAAMMEKDFRLAVDGHEITVFASDGQYVQPYKTDYLIIHQGETMDISITALPGVETAGKNFYMYVKTLEDHSDAGVRLNNRGWAILRYAGAPDEDPEPMPSRCTTEAPCKVLNCPFQLYPEGYNLTCFALDVLRSYEDVPVPATEAFEEHFLNFEFSPLGVNRIRFVNPQAPPMTQPEDANLVPCDEKCAELEGGCQCTQVLTIPFNRTVRLVLTNMGPHAYGYHPVHIHGHNPRLLKIAYPPTDPVTGRMSLSADNKDVTCVDGTECARAGWTGGKVPALNTDRPIRKNTVVVPPGGYSVFEFETLSPGWFHMHCHMTDHLFYGMALVLNLAPEKQHLFPAPPDFPRCSSMADVGPGFIANSHAAYEQLLNASSVAAAADSRVPTSFRRH